jgi:hypothetical protein
MQELLLRILLYRIYLFVGTPVKVINSARNGSYINENLGIVLNDIYHILHEIPVLKPNGKHAQMVYPSGELRMSHH